MWGTAAVHGQVCPNHESGASNGVTTSANLVEASGIAASRKNAHVLWAHNDSGDSARVFALRTDGTHLGIYTFSSASALDWEDMAIGPGPTPGVDYLYVGDIGDNLNFRSTVRVYRVPEPVVDQNQSPTTTTLTGVQSITLAYPAGPRDAETLMVDTNGDLYIVTKRVTAVGQVYRAAFPQATSGTITMELVGQIPWGSTNGSNGATGGDIAADGSAVIVRRGTHINPSATLWKRPPGTPLADVFLQPGCNYALAAEPQGEAICFMPDSMSFLTLSEGANQPLLFYQRIIRPGDVNKDDVVNVADLLEIINGWGPCDAPLSGRSESCPCDLNEDGVVGVPDLLMVINNWG